VVGLRQVCASPHTITQRPSRWARWCGCTARRGSGLGRGAGMCGWVSSLYLSITLDEASIYAMLDVGYTCTVPLRYLSRPTVCDSHTHPQPAGCARQTPPAIGVPTHLPWSRAPALTLHRRSFRIWIVTYSGVVVSGRGERANVRRLHERQRERRAPRPLHRTRGFYSPSNPMACHMRAPAKLLALSTPSSPLPRGPGQIAHGPACGSAPARGAGSAHLVTTRHCSRRRFVGSCATVRLPHQSQASLAARTRRAVSLRLAQRQRSRCCDPPRAACGAGRASSRRCLRRCRRGSPCL
jgi:hypothetical protein